jgi:hypothetical protein
VLARLFFTVQWEQWCSFTYLGFFVFPSGVPGWGSVSPCPARLCTSCTWRTALPLPPAPGRSPPPQHSQPPPPATGPTTPRHPGTGSLQQNKKIHYFLKTELLFIQLCPSTPTKCGLYGVQVCENSCLSGKEYPLLPQMFYLSEGARMWSVHLIFTKYA